MMVSCDTKRKGPVMKRKEKRTLHGVLTLMLMLGLMLIPGLLPETACATGGNPQIVAGVYQIEDYDDRQMFLEELGLEESGVVRLIQGAYRLLGLQTFFTAGADECRAWTIRKGDKAPRAAGVIHSDFERGFIRAEVIKYDDYMTYKTEAAVRAAGKMGIEGKDYVVQDGAIMHFLFKV